MWEAPWTSWAAHTPDCTATNLWDTFLLDQRRVYVCVCVCVYVCVCDQGLSWGPPRAWETPGCCPRSKVGAGLLPSSTCTPVFIVGMGPQDHTQSSGQGNTRTCECASVLCVCTRVNLGACVL